jgi:hypothetical protein
MGEDGSGGGSAGGSPQGSLGGSRRRSTCSMGAWRVEGDARCAHMLLVGEDDPHCDDPRYALYHEPREGAGHRLQSLVMGVRAGAVYLSMWRTNLCARRWSDAEAEDRAETLISGIESARWSTIVLLGAKVLRAFRRVSMGSGGGLILSAGTVRELDRDGCVSTSPSGELGPFGIFQSSIRDLRLLALPHPLGRCFAWNDRASVGRARALLRLASPEIPWGEVDV